MAGTFGRGRSKFQSGGSCTSNKKCKAGSARNQQPIRNKCKASLKAGKNHNRGLTLDPQRNYHHHLLQQPPHHPHHQNLILNSRRHITNQRGENQEDQESHPHQFHIQFQQHLYPQQEQQRKQQSYTALDTELLNPLQPPKKRSCLPPLPPPPPSSLTLSEHARKMGEPQHPHQHHQQAAATPSRAAMRGGGGGEIVEVQGGHIVRSTGRKDRHSKVCTAKGPRDRRVRLAAHTAIQFYDVQDRLGYDRPSKAVDWLIKKAKAAIDQLAELPPWNPTTTSMQPPCQEIVHCENKSLAMDDSVTAFSCQGESPAFPAAIRDSEQFSHQQVEENENANNISSSKNKYNSGSGFLPASLDSDNIAETIKTFFPVEATTTSFESYLSAPPDLGRQDLRLSLQSFQDPIMLHHQPQSHHEPVLYAGTAASALGFDGGSGWSEHQHQQQNHHSEEQRLLYAGGNSGHGGGFVFNTPATVPVPVPAFGQLFSQRGPLQSSNTPSVRAWIDPSVDHHHHHHHYLSQLIHQGSVAGGGGFSSGFSGFRIPARIQGEEEHDGVSDKPSSASSDSRH